MCTLPISHMRKYHAGFLIPSVRHINTAFIHRKLFDYLLVCIQSIEKRVSHLNCSYYTFVELIWSVLGNLGMRSFTRFI